MLQTRMVGTSRVLTSVFEFNSASDGTGEGRETVHSCIHGEMESPETIHCRSRMRLSGSNRSGCVDSFLLRDAPVGPGPVALSPAKFFGIEEVHSGRDMIPSIDDGTGNAEERDALISITSLAVSSPSNG